MIVDILYRDQHIGSKPETKDKSDEGEQTIFRENEENKVEDVAGESVRQPVTIKPNEETKQEEKPTQTPGLRSIRAVNINMNNTCDSKEEEEDPRRSTKKAGNRGNDPDDDGSSSEDEDKKRKDDKGSRDNERKERMEHNQYSPTNTNPESSAWSNDNQRG